VSLYKLFSLGAALTFAAVGLLFLLAPDAVLIFFNSMSPNFGLPAAPEQGANFYLALGAAYMYLVTLLALFMFRHPAQSIYPKLLAHAKFASAFFSIYLFLMHQPYLVYFANFIVDGCIGVAVALLIKRQHTGQGRC